MSIKHIFYVLILGVVAAGCAANINEKVIAVVGDKKITYGEFKQQYASNDFAKSDSNGSVRNEEKFLNLLVNYNLKLLDAEKEHLQDDPAIKAEMKGYEDQLAVSYIMEHELTEPMVRKIYERQKYEVRAKQVFIPFPKDSLGTVDTSKAYSEAVDVIKELKSGASIDSLIHKYRGGDTYYITAGNYLQYVGGEEFEDMLYSLKPGEVGSYPIRTAFGYLIVKLEEKRPRVESVRASHILISIFGNTPQDTLKAYNKALAIMDSMKQGVDFAKLAEDNSADVYSAKKGGDLGFFSRGMMVRPFDEAVFDMKVGQVVGPVRTRFGYHIIKLTDIKPIPPFAEVRDKIRNNYLNGGYKVDLARFVDQLKQKYNYKVNDGVLKFFYGKVDSTKRFAQTDFDSLFTPAERQEALFTFDKSAGTIDTVIAISEADAGLRALPMNWQSLHVMLDESAKQMLVTHYAAQKAPTYPDFEALIKQYEDGILIYHIEEQNVWSKVEASDSVLKPYYFDHLAKYYWPKRVDLSEIQVFNDSLANAILNMLKNGADFDSLAAKYTKRPGYAAKDGRWGLLSDSANALSEAAFKMREGNFAGPIQFEGGLSIIKVNKFVPSQPKTFEEARGEVASDYQEAESKQIQNEWLEKLRKEFGVKIYEKTFQELTAQK